jgi:hypothetical protein
VPEICCIECALTSADGAGWRAEIIIDDEAPDDREVALYCPACWTREFADDLSAEEADR